MIEAYYQNDVLSIPVFPVYIDFIQANNCLLTLIELEFYKKITWLAFH